MKLAPRTLTLAIGQGMLGGAVTAVTLGVMHALQHEVWHLAGSSRWAVPVVIITGGALLAVLHRWASDEGVAQQITDASHPVDLHRRRTAFLALSAIIAVAFGGAIGPEAGLIAVMAEVSAIVSVRLARSHAEERLIGQTGTAGSLGALYGAPTGSSMFTDDSDDDKALRLANVIAGAFGFISFLLVHGLFRAPGITLGLNAVQLSTRQVAASLIAAVFGTVLAAGYTVVRGAAKVTAERIVNAPARIMCGTLLFAVIATFAPHVRFSGHEDITQVVDLATRGAWWSLLAIAALKLIVTAINLATGWLGGDFFPLILSGAAIGLLSCSFVTLPPEAAAIAGGTAAVTVGMRKPAVTFVIVVLVSGGVAVPAALIGAAIGLAAAAMLPEPAPTH